LRCGAVRAVEVFEGWLTPTRLEVRNRYAFDRRTDLAASS
jgi:hypothetical protein